MPGQLGWETLVNGLATLGASFAGAWAAFKLQRGHEAGKLRAAQVEECNRTLLVLMLQMNAVINCRRQIMDPFRDHPGRHFVMPPTGQMDYSHLPTNAAGLAFLLQTEARELPQMVASASENFHRFVAAVNDRAVLHHELQAAIEASSVDMETGVAIEVVEQGAGLRLTIKMKSATEAVFMLAAAAEAALTGIGRDMPRVLRQLYKGEKFIGFAPDEEAPEAPAASGPVDKSSLAHRKPLR